MPISRADMAKIQIARKELGMDDAAYRAMLQRVAGVQSSTKLGAMTVGKVLAELRRLGWKPSTKSKAGRARPRVPASREKIMKKVEALLAEAGRPWSYADSMAWQMQKIERVEWLDDNQLQRLMQALIIDAGRHGR